MADIERLAASAIDEAVKLAKGGVDPAGAGMAGALAWIGNSGGPQAFMSGVRASDRLRDTAASCAANAGSAVEGLDEAESDEVLAVLVAARVVNDALVARGFQVAETSWDAGDDDSWEAPALDDVGDDPTDGG
jgi:hypothetical protein